MTTTLGTSGVSSVLRSICLLTFISLIAVACGSAASTDTSGQATSDDTPAQADDVSTTSSTVPTPEQLEEPDRGFPDPLPGNDENLNTRTTPVSRLCWINREVTRRVNDYVLKTDEVERQVAFEETERWLVVDGPQLAKDLRDLKPELPEDAQTFADYLTAWFDEASTIAADDAKSGEREPAIFSFYVDDTGGDDDAANRFGEGSASECEQLG